MGELLDTPVESSKRDGIPGLVVWLISSFALFLLFVLLVTLNPFAWGPARHFWIGETCEVELPHGPKKLIFQRIRIHPFVAEYSRQVRLSSSSRSHPLLVNTGGGTYVNVFWINNNGRPMVRMDDALGEYLLDIQNDEMYLVVREGKRAFVAPLLTEDVNVFVGIPDNNPAKIEVKVDGQSAKPWASLISNPQERYIGVISGPTNRLVFCNAVDCPESTIEKPFDPWP